MKMPLADKPALTDLSDEEEALSPTDGYFQASSHDSRRVWVEDPAASSSVKGYEVDDTKYHPSLHQHYTTTHSQASSSPSLLHTNLSHPRNVPPPAYTPSPPTTTTPSTSPRTGYQTFGPSNSTMGLPVEQQRLIPRPPESMGDHNPGIPQRPSRWQRFTDGVDRLELKKRLKRSFGVLLALCVIAVLVMGFGGRDRDKTPPFDHGNGHAPKHPNMDHDGKLTWTPRGTCRNSNLVHTDESFVTPWTASRSLNVVQEITRYRPGDGHARSPHVYGEILLRPVDTAEEARVDVQVITNDEAIHVEISAGRDNQDIRVIVPSSIPWDSNSEAPCVQISMTVSAPHNASLSSLSLSTVQLDVLVQESLALHLNDPLVISSVSGSVSTPNLSAAAGFTAPAYTLGTRGGRSIRVNTVSGAIEGWFPLYDALHLRSVSGDVRVNVTPQKHRPDGDGSDPATLHVSSESGLLSVDEGVENKDTRELLLPPRDYRVDMQTASGKVTARVASSTQTRIKTRSGNIDVALYLILAQPAPDTRQRAEFHTETISGSTLTHVLNPTRSFWVSSSHASVSGGIRLRYAESWAGSILASAVSAKLSVRGRDVVVDERQTGPGAGARGVGAGSGIEGTQQSGWLRKIRAHKGDPSDGRIVANTVSGDIDVLIGDE